MIDEDDIPDDVKRGVEKALVGAKLKTTTIEVRRGKRGSKYARQKMDTSDFPAAKKKDDLAECAERATQRTEKT